MDPTHLDAEKKRSPVALLAGVGFAILLSAGLFFGYLALRDRHAKRASSVIEAAPPPRASPEAEIYEDEAKIKGSDVTIGGTVRNISARTLSSAEVDLELIRRIDGKKESMTIALTPPTVAPGGESKYEIVVKAKSYNSVRVARLIAAENRNGVPFKSFPGSKRPAEKPTPTTIIVNGPRPRGKGEEFLNTPDTPIKVP